MSLLSEIYEAIEGCGYAVETGCFKDTAPDEYAAITPLSDTFEMHADNIPTYCTQEARISLFSKGNYSVMKYAVLAALFKAGFRITDVRYIEHEDDTGYHHVAIDAAKTYFAGSYTEE